MKKEKWLVPVIAVGIAAVVVIFAVGGYMIYQYVFPMAAPIDCPNIESVTTMSLIQNGNISVTVEAENFGEFLQTISNAQPTRIWSVSDYPVAKNYSIITIGTSEREYRYFVYVENSQVYIDSPYEGVYQANQQILDLVSEHFEN